MADVKVPLCSCGKPLRYHGGLRVYLCADEHVTTVRDYWLGTIPDDSLRNQMRRSVELSNVRLAWDKLLEGTDRVCDGRLP
jgi:hypothetical protein